MAQAMRGIVCRINTDTEIYGYGEAALSSVQYAQAVEKYGIYYFEEGTYPMNKLTAKNAARKINIPMANGERIYTR